MKFYVVQIGIEIPDDLEATDTPEQAPRMGELLAQVEQIADEFGDGAMVSGYVYNPYGQQDCLVRTLRKHRQTPQGRCECGWPGGMGESHDEHVARVFEVAATIEASQ